MNHDLLPSCDSEANGPLSISSLKQVVLPAMSSPIPFFSLFWLFLFSVFFYSCGIDLCTQDHFYQHRNILFCCLPQKEKKKNRRKENCTFSPVSWQSKFLILKTLVTWLSCSTHSGSQLKSLKSRHQRLLCCESQ